MRRKDWLVLVGFAAGVLLLRLATLPRSVLDWDESLFLIMGRALLRGEAPYATVWDHSPLGAPILLAFAQMVFGQSVIVLRLVTWLAVTFAAFALYRLGNLLGRQGAGWIAGVCYAVLSLTNTGLAAQRELLFAPFVAAALYLILSCDADAARPARRTGLRFLLAGLLLGFGLQLKYLYVLDVAAVGLIATLVLWPQRPASLRAFAGRTLPYYALLAVGPILFLGLTAGYAALKGSFSDYLYANFIVGGAYVASGKFALADLFKRLIGQVTGSPLLWVSLALTPIYLARARDVARPERRAFLFVLIWLAAAFAGTLISGKLWSHYFLQLLPPLCLLTGLLLTGTLRPDPGYDPVKRNLALILAVAASLLPLIHPPLASSLALLRSCVLRGAELPPDRPAQVAAYLAARVTPEDGIYVADYEPILYYLVDARQPTRYIFPPHLISARFEGVDVNQPLQELDQIMTEQPRYVIRTSPPITNFSNAAYRDALDQYLAERYVIEKQFETTATSEDGPYAVVLHRLRSAR